MGEEEDRRAVKVITQKMLQQRARAEKFAPSGINVGALVFGTEVGQPGACPRILSKLLTAAKWYSQGKDGTWHEHDITWNCTDRKDMFGRVTEENGRLIWRLQDEEVNACVDLVQPLESNGHDVTWPCENSWSRLLLQKVPPASGFAEVEELWARILRCNDLSAEGGGRMQESNGHDVTWPCENSWSRLLLQKVPPASGFAE